MKYSASLTSLSILAFLVLHCSADATIVEQVCEKFSEADPNIKFDFCVTALGSDPSSRTASLGDLAFISLKQSTSSATSFGPKIQSLLQGRKYDPKILNDCLGFYSDANNKLQAAAEDFKAKDYDKANVDLKAAMNDGKNCGDEFKRAGTASPLAQDESDFFQLVAISLSFSNLLR